LNVVPSLSETEAKAPAIRVAQAEPSDAFALLGDQPHVEVDDPLGFDQIAADLTRLVLASRSSTPFTLGVDAGWGMGKSSLMRHLQARLAIEQAVHTVWFNAWTSEGGSVLEGLIKSVLDQIDPNILRRALRKKRMMSWVRVGASVVASWLRLGNLVDDFWRQVSIDPRARNEIQNLMIETMDRWRAKDNMSMDDRLLVVFVDDLDRCSPSNVFELFEAIKLYLDAPGFVFVIGFDQGIISDSILTQKQYSKSVTSRDYLEKIIQIGYRIPQPDDEQAEKLMSSLVERSNTASLFDESAKTLVIERNARNPRRIKRFVNGFILEYGLDEDWKQLGAAALIKVLILHIYFPRFVRLFDERSERDPITEFLDFLKVRSTVRRRPSEDSSEWAQVDEVFDTYALAHPERTAQGSADALQILEQELPEPFVELAHDENFVSLINGFGDSVEREQLRRKLERRRYAPEISTPIGDEAVLPREPEKVEPTLLGLRILWIDENLEKNRSVIESVERLGARVDAVRTDEETMLYLRKGGEAIDVIVSDRPREPNLLLDAVGSSEVRDFGAQVVFTSRVTPSLRRAADELGALGVTNDPAELIAILDQEAAVRREVPARAASKARKKGRILIDYRREDATGYAGRLYDRLAADFGNENLFMDLPSIQAGVDFSQSIRGAVASSDVVIEIIGPRWLSGTGPDGNRRLDDPGDFIRLTLSTALAQDKPVIPVLVEGASMPTQDELPEDIAVLARRNALEISPTRWDYDVGRLIEVIDGLLDRETKTVARDETTA
jgi:KAP family P-loop domain/TIR domain